MKTSLQSGSHVIAVAMLLLALGVIGFAGYRVYQMQQPVPVSDTGTTTTTATAPAAITNTATLDQASSALDSESSQVSSSLDDTALNADINSML